MEILPKSKWRPARKGVVTANDKVMEVCNQKLEVDRGLREECVRVGCESLKAACTTTTCGRWQGCLVASHFSGDWISPKYVNLFRRALGEDPSTPLEFKFYCPVANFNAVNGAISMLTPDPILALGTIGPQGEADLLLTVDNRLKQAEKDSDDVGDDLNLIVMLLLSRVNGNYETTISKEAVRRYATARPPSLGSDMLQYYKKYKSFPGKTKQK